MGREKLAKLTTPRINTFRDDLLASMSRAMAKKVMVSLKAWGAARIDETLGCGKFNLNRSVKHDE